MPLYVHEPAGVECVWASRVVWFSGLNVIHAGYESRHGDTTDCWRFRAAVDTWIRGHMMLTWMGVSERIRLHP